MQLKASDFEKLTETGRGIKADVKDRGRFIELSINIAGRVAINGRAFKGSKFIKPWIELGYEFRKRHAYEELSEIFKAFFRILPPGGYVMVKYSSHREVARALAIGVPEAATELGYALLKAGFTWFKDWYFPEGGMEGEEKLQANKALTREHESKRRKKLIEQLESFIEKTKKDKELANYVKAAERAIKILKEKDESS